MEKETYHMKTKRCWCPRSAEISAIHMGSFETRSPFLWLCYEGQVLIELRTDPVPEWQHWKKLLIVLLFCFAPHLHSGEQKGLVKCFTREHSKQSLCLSLACSGVVTATDLAVQVKIQQTNIFSCKVFGLQNRIKIMKKDSTWEVEKCNKCTLSLPMLSFGVTWVCITALGS